MAAAQIVSLSSRQESCCGFCSSDRINWSGFLISFSLDHISSSSSSSGSSTSLHPPRLEITSPPNKAWKKKSLSRKLSSRGVFPSLRLRGNLTTLWICECFLAVSWASEGGSGGSPEAGPCLRRPAWGSEEAAGRRGLNKADSKSQTWGRSRTCCRRWRAETCCPLRSCCPNSRPTGTVSTPCFYSERTRCFYSETWLVSHVKLWWSLMMSDDFHIAIATHGSVVVRRVAARLCGESHALSADSDDVTVLLFSIFVFGLSNSLSTERCWTWVEPSCRHLLSHHCCVSITNDLSWTDL